MARYQSRVKLPTVLLVLFLGFLAYFVSQHWDIDHALHGAGRFAVVMIGVIVAFVVFDVVVGAIFWLAGKIGSDVSGLFGAKDKTRK